MADDANFADGLIVKKRDKAPDFVLCDLSFKTSEFINWLKANDNGGWVNVQALVSKNGKPYAQLNSWKPDADKAPAKPSYSAPVQPQSDYNRDDSGDEIPF